MNFEGAFGDRRGVVAVVRDWEGRMIAAVGVPLPFAVDEAFAEIRAIIVGLKLVGRIRAAPFILETDYSVVVS